MRSNAFFSSFSRSPVTAPVLRATFGGILATASVCSVACSQPVVCGGCGCGGSDASVTPYDVTYTVCGSADAGSEAAADAGVAADAGGCFTSCFEACAAMKPLSAHGTGVCVAEPDAGAGATVTVNCRAEILCTGRKLEGLVEPQASWLAKAAWLEAASVHAFVRLARELESYGAPAALVRRAKACARDEARHARIMRKLAKKHGASVPRVEVRDMNVRSLERIAVENAVEGCVAETYGALVAAWQATNEHDPDLASAMRSIAPDELRHAALGWSVAAWLDTRLDPAARYRVKAARAGAAQDLIARAPTRCERTLATGLMQTLWAA